MWEVMDGRWKYNVHTDFWYRVLQKKSPLTKEEYMYSVQAATHFLNAGYGVYSLLLGIV